MARSNIIASAGRFKRVAEAFDEAARGGMMTNCESSGSEHFPSDNSGPTNGDDLSHPVNSFIEKDLVFYRSHDDDDDDDDKENDDEEEFDAQVNYNNNSDDWFDSDETKDMLRSLFLSNNTNDQDARNKMRAEIHSILTTNNIDNSSNNNSKRKLMSRLRDRGFDAGLCKSRWAKSGRHLGGDYEYVDVNIDDMGGKRHRYIIEVNLSGEFEIARPTNDYSSLLHVFPPVFVGEAEELKQVVRSMSRGIRESMKTMGLKVPPWRRNGYMQSKWFSPYKRTTNEIPASQMGPGPKRFIGSNGFEVLPVRASNQRPCKDDFVGKMHFKVGCLTAALLSDGMDM